MKAKSTPIISKVLAFLSGFNLVMMIICVGSILYARENLHGSGVLIGLVLGQSGEMVMQNFSQLLTGFTWFFVVANLVVSSVMAIVALALRGSKPKSTQAINNTYMVTSSSS